MRKSALLLFLFLLFVIKVPAQSFIDTPVVQTTTIMNLAGKIDSVTELTLAMRVMDRGAGLQKTMTVGDSVITVPDTSLLLLEERSLKFNEKGFLELDRTGKTNGKTPELRSYATTRYSYKKGKILSVVNYSNGTLVDSSVFIYKRDGLWKIDKYNDKKKHNGRILYGLNPDDKLLTISHKNADNALVSMTRFKYNEQYDLIESALHDNTMKLVSTRTFVVERDTADRQHVMIFDFAKPDTATGMTSYLLDDNGNHLEDVLQDEQKRVTYYSTSRYDSLNNIIEQTSFAMEKLHVRYTYVYDKYSNWVEKRVFHNDVPYQLVKRTIYYHPVETP